MKEIYRVEYIYCKLICTSRCNTTVKGLSQNTQDIDIRQRDRCKPLHEKKRDLKMAESLKN